MSGVISRGITAPIIKAGDDIVKIVVDSVLAAQTEDKFELMEGDIIAVTESVVARADNNYCSIDDIAKDIHRKKMGNRIGLVFPILSRNRFAVCLRGIARAADSVIIQFSLPADEVGNHLISREQYYDWDGGYFSETRFHQIFGEPVHPFTGVDYLTYYRKIIESEGAAAEFFFSNNPEQITHKNVTSIICCDIHTRNLTKKIIGKYNQKIFTLSDIMNEPINSSGYNPIYGLLGSNKATEETVKLFPKNAPQVAAAIQSEYYARTGVKVEAMVYGDGAFKDPVGEIWELADPVVSPGFTDGLRRVPNELKLKYLADNEFKDLSGDELADAIRDKIQSKTKNLVGRMESQGTTPRFVPDLVGSLCDLTSGSGDKGTPIVVVQNYFKNYGNQ